MEILVTQTKITLPARRPDLLSRQRLLELVYDLLDYKLIVVAAPAGYGKTSLLVDFASRADIPVCWYSLDSLDSDPQRFIAHFIAALSKQFPTFGDRSIGSLEATNQANLDLDRIIATIVNDAYDNIREHFLIILDDYHLISGGEEVDYFLNRFIQEVGENCHLVLSSRTLLSLPDMPLLVAHSQVGGLSFDELAFQPEEIQSLALQNFHMVLPEHTAKELAQETEGWITGLLLSTHTMWQGTPDQLRIARVSGVGLYDYLAQQVLDQQSPDVRLFLLRTSILEEFDAELCEAILGNGYDISFLMGTILQNNLFILPVGEDGKWLRYHHLFRDFLQSRLELERPDEKNDILRRLANLYADTGLWEKSYATYQRLGDVDAIVNLVERAGSPLLKMGRIITLAEWIDELPTRIVESRSNLLSIRGGVDIMRGRLVDSLEWLARAEVTQRDSGDSSNLAITLLRKATAQRFLGEYQDSQEIANEALSLAIHNEGLLAVQAEAHRIIGMSFLHLGQLPSADERLSISLDLYNQLGDLENVALVEMELGLSSMNAGRYQRAMSYYKNTLDYWRSTHNTVGQANLLNNLGVLYYLMGDYEQAGLIFEEALTYAKQSDYSRMEAFILCGIGDLYADLEAGDPALDAYDQSRVIALRENNRFLLLYIDLAVADEYRKRGELEQSQNYIYNAEIYNQDNGSPYEKGLLNLCLGRLCLSTGNVEEAIEYLGMAANQFTGSGQRIEAAKACLYLAYGYHLYGKDNESLVNLAESLRLESEVDSKHILVVTGKEVKPILNKMKGDPSVGIQTSELLGRIIQFEESIPSLRKSLRPHAATVEFAPPKLTIKTLGSTELELDGKPVTAVEWQNQRKAREFFYLLLSHPEGLTKEEVGVEIWPESSPSQLKLQFKNAIYRLRHSLGQDMIAFDADRYWFNRSIDYTYDVDAFLSNVILGRSSLEKADKIEAYKSALELYTGSYLIEMDSTWVVTERERLDRLYEESKLTLARIYITDSEYESSLIYSLSILDEDQCHEEAHRLAMQAYAALGDRAAVTRQYDRCRMALMNEVEAQPSPQTVMLYESLIK
jgi:ATP/maltotriose-dependent transcriptional regulator MalT/DNA-binding SARP family transcriptional activator